MSKDRHCHIKIEFDVPIYDETEASDRVKEAASRYALGDIDVYTENVGED